MFLNSVLLKKFFDTFRKYNFDIPIETVKLVKKNKPLDKFVYYMKYYKTKQIWNPYINKKERYNKMILLNPVYPSMNSTPNINEYSLKIMKSELERGYSIVEQIEEGKLVYIMKWSLLLLQTWDKLIEPSDFFYKYNQYIAITISAGSSENMLKWLGYCESKLRIFIERLGNTNQYNNIHLHPIGYYNPKIVYYYSIYNKQNDKNAVYFVGLDVKNKEQKLDISIPKMSFLSLISKESRYRFNYISLDMKMDISVCESIDLETYLELHLSLYQLKKEITEEEKKYLESEAIKRKSFYKYEKDEDEEVKNIRKRLKRIKIIETY